MRYPVKTSYQKVARKKKTPVQEIPAPSSGLSPLAQYVEENMGVGIPVDELVRQFQEYDCEHDEWAEVMTGPGKEVWEQCKGCGLIKRRK